MKLKLLLIPLIVLLTISVIPALGFSDGFNGYTGTYNIGGTFGGWLVSGSNSVNFISPNPFDGSQFINLTNNGVQIHNNAANNSNYTSVEMNVSSGSALFNFKDNGVGTSAGFDYSTTGLITLVEYGGAGAPVMSFNSVQINPAKQWIRIVSNISNNNQINIKIYAQNGSLVSEQSSSITKTSNLNQTTLISNGGASFDNFVASVSNPTTATSITFASKSYVKSDQVFFNWVISDANWNNWFGLQTFSTRITDPDGLVLGDPSIFGIPQTGTMAFVATKTGTYTAQLNVGFVTYVTATLATDTTVINSPTASYILTNSSVAAGIPFTVSYVYGNTPVAQGELESVVFEILSSDGYKPYQTISLGNTNIVAGTQYATQMTVYDAGHYRISLFDLKLGKVAHSEFDAYAADIPVQVNLSTSYIDMDKPAYFYNEIMVIGYGIDNTNFSKYSNKHFNFSNLDNGRQGFSTPALIKQEGKIMVGIGTSCSSGTFEIQCYTDTGAAWYSGNNSISIIANNGTSGTVTIISNNFTINKVDVDGYSLTVTPTSACTNTQIIIGYTATNAATLTVMRNSDLVNYINVTVNGTNRSLNIGAISKSGGYTVRLTDSLGVTHYNIPLTILENCVGTPTPTATPPSIPTGDKAVSNLGDNLKNFMAMPAFWGLVLTIFAFFAIGKTVPNAMGFGMFIVMNVEAVIGMYDPYKMYILVITWVFAGIYFALGRKVLSGG